MKSYKFILGIGGVMALALTSCHDDPEYHPADSGSTPTPAAYFNMSEDTDVTLEQESTEFEVTAYRAEGIGTLTAPVTVTVTAPEGVNTQGVFTLPTAFEFADGKTISTAKITFDMANVEPLKNYEFHLKLEGESSPYLLTEITYTASYTPWQIVTNEETGSTVSVLSMDGILTRPWDLEVEVYSHPDVEGLYRIYRPYLNAPEIQGAEQIQPLDDPRWLYINAKNPNGVFFADAKGNPQVIYETGWNLFADEADTEIPGVDGELYLLCLYSSFLNETNLSVPGASGAYGWEQFSGEAGQMVEGNISFTDSKIYWTYPGRVTDESGYLLSLPAWKLRLASAAEIKEWETLGMAEFQEPFLGNYLLGEPLPAYEVTVEQNIENPDKYRILNPYLADGGFEFPSVDEGTYNLVFDCSNPDCVLMEIQSLGFVDDHGVMLQGCNTGAWMYYGYGGETSTFDQIIADGDNDTFKDNIINLDNPVMIVGDQGYFLKSNKGFTPGYLALPAANAAPSKKAAREPKMHLNGRFQLQNEFTMHRSALRGKFHRAN